MTDLHPVAPGKEGGKRKRQSSLPATDTTEQNVTAPAAGTQAVPTWASLSIHNRTVRRNALVSRLGGYPVDMRALNQFLAAANGDLDIAEAAIRAEHARLVAVQGNNSHSAKEGEQVHPGGLQSPVPSAGGHSGFEESIRAHLGAVVAGIQIPYRESAEQERRELVETLRVIINARRDEENQIQLSRSEALMALELSGWDVFKAEEMFAAQDALLEKLHKSVDHLRDHTNVQEEQDERLARLLWLTRRPDWYSVQQHLATHHWDYVSAAVAWQRSGIAPVDHPLNGKGTRTKGAGLRVTWEGFYHTLPRDEDVMTNVGDDSDWKEDQSVFMEEGEDEKTERQMDQPLMQKDRKRPRGFLINPDTEPARVHCKEPSKMLIEFISKGKYFSNRFEHRNYSWTGLGKSKTDKSKPTFDWDNQDHVDHLSTWRRENNSRITGRLLRPRSQKFSEAEKKFLRQMWDEYSAEVSARDSKAAARRPLTVPETTKQEFVRRFNKEFAGKTGAGGQVIKPRAKGGLFTQAGRDPYIQGTYGKQAKGKSKQPQEGNKKDDSGEDGKDGKEEEAGGRGGS